MSNNFLLHVFVAILLVFYLPFLRPPHQEFMSAATSPCTPQNEIVEDSVLE